MAHAELVFAQLGITVRDVSRCTVVAFGTNGTFKTTGSIGVDDENDWRLGFRICEAPFRGKFRQPFEVDRGAVSKEDSGDLVWVLGRALSTPPWALRSRSSTTNAGGE